MLAELLQALPPLDIPFVPGRASATSKYYNHPLPVPTGVMAFVPHPWSRLPPETLDEIISFVPPTSRPALALVSRRLCTLTLRQIYANLVLRSPVAVVQCCRTLVHGNPLAGRAVRTFEISYPSRPFRLLHAFYTLIAQALEHIPNVRCLSLLVPDPSFATVLTLTGTLTLPRLVHFNSRLSISDPGVVPFLRRHRQISYLQLNEHSACPWTRSSAPPSIAPDIDITLPKLEYFSGNSAALAPVIQGGAALRAAFITWDSDAWPPVDVLLPVSVSGELSGSDPDAALVALGRNCTDTLNFLECRRQGWNLDLLDRIATHLPHIYALSLTNVFSSTEGEPDGGAEPGSAQPLANISAIASSLRRFSCLERLIITCINAWYPWEECACDMDAAFDAVTAWGAACASLVECTPPQSPRIRWIRVVDNFWLPDLASLPMPSSLKAQCVRWLAACLRNSSYPWKRIVETMPVLKAFRAKLELLDCPARVDSAIENSEEFLALRRVRFSGVGWDVDVDEDFLPDSGE
uniref:F-box domain-containing protein n=1 Tax=Mycena chlorophos TaxID=658473 RepID=A0ABQ0MB76_MYCCL|nr:predicted protein [Mycena chlorophos]